MVKNTVTLRSHEVSWDILIILVSCIGWLNFLRTRRQYLKRRIQSTTNNDLWSIKLGSRTGNSTLPMHADAYLVMTVAVPSTSHRTLDCHDRTPGQTYRISEQSCVRVNIADIRRVALHSFDQSNASSSRNLNIHSEAREKSFSSCKLSPLPLTPF